MPRIARIWRKRAPLPAFKNAMILPNKINIHGPLFGICGLSLLAISFVFADALVAIAPATADAADIKIGVAIVNKWQSLLGALFTPLAPSQFLSSVAGQHVWLVLRCCIDCAAAGLIFTI